MSIDLAAANAHLNLTTSDNDVVVTRLIAAATDWFETQLGYKIADRYPDGVPPAVDQGILLMIGHWFANREATLVGVSATGLPFGVADIVNDYRDWSWGEADGE